MTNTAMVSIRIDSDVKNYVSNLSKSYGLDLSSLLRSFVYQIHREKVIPLHFETIKSKNFVPNKKFAKLLDEVEDDIINDRNIIKFNNNDEAIDYLRSKI